MFNKFYPRPPLPECRYLQPYIITRVTCFFVLTIPYFTLDTILLIKACDVQGEVLMLGMGTLIFQHHEIGKRFGFKKIGWASLVLASFAFLPAHYAESVFMYPPEQVADVVIKVVADFNLWARSSLLRRCTKYVLPTGDDRFWTPAQQVARAAAKAAKAAAEQFAEHTSKSKPRTPKELRDFTREQIKKGWGSHKPPK